MTRLLPIDERFLGAPDAWADPGRARCVVVPAPFESTSSYGEGSARGPEAILHASHQVEFYDCRLGFEPCEASGGILTAAPLAVGGLRGERVADALRHAAAAWLDEDKFVVTLGGEHTSTIGAIRAHTDRFPDCTVLQLDAHSDLRDSYEGDAWSHASAMARVLDFHDRLVQIGIRSEAAEEAQTRRRREIPCFHAWRIHDAEHNGTDWVERVLTSCGQRVYVTLDCDVFDPSVIPATGTPEPGGLSWRQINALLSRLFKEREVVGVDISELAPMEGFHHAEFTIAKLVYRLIGWRFAPSHPEPSAVSS